MLVDIRLDARQQLEPCPYLHLVVVSVFAVQLNTDTR